MTSQSRPVELIIVGAGCRGGIYASYVLEHPDRAKVVAVAEPREFQRQSMAGRHKIGPENQFESWQQLAEKPKLADAVLICTQDDMHVEPALAFIERGYHVLLEKPMALGPDQCRQIADAAVTNNVMLAVCHVLRYTPYTQKLKEVINAGTIGEIVSVQRLEPIGYWHFAHSYVRGNWANEEVSPILLAKSCHDLDWISYIIGGKCTKISSFANLSHFKCECAPPTAAERCLDCPVEADCPYSAKKIYIERIKASQSGWPVDIITDDLTVEGVTEALRTGPYGRCVYHCDNTVPDHQVVSMQFAGGQTATFTLAAFTEMGHRRTSIFGTRGEIYGDGDSITIYDFLTDRRQTIDMHSSEASIIGGHGGGDMALIEAFVSALASNDPSLILSGPLDSLESHMMVFDAETARKTNTVIEM